LGCLELVRAKQQTVLSLFLHQRPAAAVVPILLLLAVLVREQLLPMEFVDAAWLEKHC
jgi:hypothetical protein